MLSWRLDLELHAWVWQSIMGAPAHSFCSDIGPHVMLMYAWGRL